MRQFSNHIVVMIINKCSVLFKKKRSEKMNTDEKFYKKLELYPIIKQTILIYDSVERLKYLINLRGNGIPDDLYAVYLRMCIQMDTQDIPLNILHEAFEGITKEMIMYDSELEDFFNLPEIITIFRGTDCNEDPPRISWSLLEEKAKWFYNGKMFKAEIPKDSILAFFNQNTDEKEVLVLLESGYSVIY